MALRPSEAWCQNGSSGRQRGPNASPVRARFQSTSATAAIAAGTANHAARRARSPLGDSRGHNATTHTPAGMNASPAYLVRNAPVTSALAPMRRARVPRTRDAGEHQCGRQHEQVEERLAPHFRGDVHEGLGQHRDRHGQRAQPRRPQQPPCERGNHDHRRALQQSVEPTTDVDHRRVRDGRQSGEHQREERRPRRHVGLEPVTHLAVISNSFGDRAVRDGIRRQARAPRPGRPPHEHCRDDGRDPDSHDRPPTLTVGRARSEPIATGARRALRLTGKPLPPKLASASSDPS